MVDDKRMCGLLTRLPERVSPGLGVLFFPPTASTVFCFGSVIDDKENANELQAPRHGGHPLDFRRGSDG
jgi:hypothetical protein